MTFLKQPQAMKVRFRKMRQSIQELHVRSVLLSKELLEDLVYCAVFGIDLEVDPCIWLMAPFVDL